MINKMKQKIERKESVLGTFFEIGGSLAVECLGIAGLDFLIIDTEHGPFDVESAMDYIRAAERRDITPLVRIKEISRSAVLKMLDVGAKGLIIPCVETVEQVKQLVEYGKYYPVGQRGFILARAAGYGFDAFAKNTDEYFATCNRETMIIPQCETMGCLENIEEIAAMSGVDGIFVGPYDLSISMGKPAQFADPEFKAALARITKACEAAGKPVFIYTGNNADAKRYFQEGFQGVALNMDAAVYINAYKKIYEEVLGE